MRSALKDTPHSFIKSWNRLGHLLVLGAKSIDIFL